MIDWLKHLAISWNWHMAGDETVRIGPYVAELTPYYFELMWREWQSWKKWYLPPWSLKGKVILDVGAGCGETALFYYLHGARRVIAVEPESSLVPLLKKNMAHNKWDMEVVESPFHASMLDWNFDFMKMDGEGCEAQLLTSNSLPPCAIEGHNKRVVDRLRDRFETNILPQKDNWILQNFAELPLRARKESEGTGP
ncbi:hypothetical protein AUI46_06225 [archaeon 13_1_40CM_2_52_13]|nr:MAG: hypothetical protein AUI46_06225 [archaeon 13_1_40CM_2_52_13]